LDKMMSERKHLVFAEVEKLIEAAKGSRNAARDRCLLLLMFRHGLRVSEACGLKLSQVNTESRVLDVARLKAGLSTTHPLRSDELRVSKIWLAERAKMKPETDAFFINERRGPLSRKTAWVAIRDYGRQTYPLRPIPTSCGTRAVLPLPTRAQIRGLFRTTLDIEIFSTPSCTQQPIQHVLKDLSGNDERYILQCQLTAIA
jgi:integrase